MSKEVSKQSNWAVKDVPLAMELHRRSSIKPSCGILWSWSSPCGGRPSGCCGLSEASCLRCKFSARDSTCCSFLSPGKNLSVAYDGENVQEHHRRSQEELAWACAFCSSTTQVQPSGGTNCKVSARSNQFPRSARSHGAPSMARSKWSWSRSTKSSRRTWPACAGHQIQSCCS